MELLTKYWWVALGIIAILFLMSRSGGSPGTTTQIGAGSNEAALASIDAQAYASDQSNRYGFASKLLDWVTAREGMGLTERLTLAGYQTQSELAQLQSDAAASSNALAAQVAQAQYNANLQAQLAAIAAARKNSNNQALMSIFSGGLQTFAPILQNWLGGGGGSSGGWYGGTPTFNPGGFSFGGGW